jgi:hypothetical protein
MTDFHRIPSFIPAEIVDAPIDCKWESAREHIGPTETVTPLLKNLGRGNGLAQVAMCAGILLWLTWRLKSLTKEAGQSLELAEAAFAYTVDWRYVDLEAGTNWEAPDQPPADSATMKVNNFIFDTLDHDAHWSSFYTPVGSTFHTSHIVQHVIPKAHRRDFEQWLAAVSDRMAQHFPLPDLPERDFDSFDTEEEYDAYCAPRRGVAVPPQLLDPSFGYDPFQREKLVEQFLQGLDRSRNRFLRSPEAMLELGFVGTPYKP